MFNRLFRILLTINSTSLLVIIYLIKEDKQINLPISNNFLSYIEENLPDWVLNRLIETLDLLPLSYIFYLIVPIFLTYLSIIISRFLGKDSFEHSNIQDIELANNSFLPSYLGYFFVALSIPNNLTLAFVYGILFVFTFCSQALYFNPLFLLYRYDFYNITTKNGTKVFLISKRNYKRPNEVNVEIAYRINNFTFIER